MVDFARELVAVASEDPVVSENSGDTLASTQPVVPFQVLVAALLGWLQREQGDVIAFLREENRALKAQLTGRRLRLTDTRCRLAVLGQRLGRTVLRDVATLVTPTPSFDGIVN